MMKKPQKKILISITLVMFMFAATFSLAQATTSNTQTTLTASDIIELLISLEIIPADKAELARTMLREKTGEVKTTSSCVSLYKNLYLGMEDSATGGEVTKLQKYLKGTGDFAYPEVTGYFGPATEVAVQKWQARMKVVTSGSPETTGYGVVGPVTRTKMSCGDFKAEAHTTTEEKTEQNSTVTSIKATADDAAGKVAWSTNGVSSKGFKIVWSKNSGPTYPTRSGDKYVYLTDPKAVSTALSAFDGSGTYHVRVCEYLGGSCGVYSNEVEIEL